MARNQLGLEFDGLDELVKDLQKVGASIETTAEKALEETFETVTPGILEAINKSRYNFNRPGGTKDSLQKRAEIERNGSTIAVPVGFDIDSGGLPSIFLMYGTPSITPDRNLYNSIFGKKVVDKVADVQERVFLQEIRKQLGD